MIVDQKKYSLWIEEKNKGRTSLKLSSAVKGEIVRPKSAAKRLNDHSLTRLNKRTFEINDNLKQLRPHTANPSVNR